MVRCRGKTINGDRCSRHTKKGPYCYQHQSSGANSLIEIPKKIKLKELCSLQWRIGKGNWGPDFDYPAIKTDDCSFWFHHKSPPLQESGHEHRIVDTGTNDRYLRVRFHDNPPNIYFTIKQPFTLAKFIKKLGSHYDRTDCNVRGDSCLVGSPDNGIFNFANLKKENGQNVLMIYTAS